MPIIFFSNKNLSFFLLFVYIFNYLVFSVWNSQMKTPFLVSKWENSLHPSCKRSQSKDCLIPNEKIHEKILSRFQDWVALTSKDQSSKHLSRGKVKINSIRFKIYFIQKILIYTNKGYASEIWYTLQDILADCTRHVLAFDSELKIVSRFIHPIPLLLKVVVL